MLPFLFLLTSACDSSTPSAPPAAIVLLDGVAPTATVGTAAGTPRIEVHDDRGRAIGGVPLTIEIAGGGTLAPRASETRRGPTSLGTWTLGTTAGVQSLTVRAGGLAPLVISTDALAGAPAALLRSGGEDGIITGEPSTVAPRTPAVVVRDAFGNPVAGVMLTVDVTGGGSVQDPSPVTDVNGLATVGSWTFGPAAGPQSVTMRLGGLPPVVFSAAVQSGGFGIVIRYVGTPPSPAVQAIFAAAADRVSQIIVGDLAPVAYEHFDYATECDLPGAPVISEIIDDLLIYVLVTPIDGPFGVLAQAGPCEARLPSLHPVLGDVIFDVADLELLHGTGALPGVVLHELLHVVGIGTIWGDGLLGLLAGQGSGNPSFMGNDARAAFLAIGGNPALTGVPVENMGGPGTADAHWRESVLGRELMTGFHNAGVPNPLSAVTVAALADLGYLVDLTKAEAFSLANPSLRLGPVVVAGHDEIRRLRGLRTAAGAGLRLPGPRRR